MITPMPSSESPPAQPHAGKTRSPIETIVRAGFLGALLVALLPWRANGANGLVSGSSITHGLVSLWRAEGDVIDSVNAIHATSTSAGYAPGKLGQSFAFDGRGKRIEFGDVPELRFTDQFGFDFWMYLNDATPFGGGQVILFRGDARPGLDPYAVAINFPQQLIFKIDNEQGESTRVEMDVPLRTWLHVAVVFSEGRLMLYVNGELAAETHGTVLPFATLMAGGGFVLGNTTASHNFPFNGLIDEIAAYSRALSASEVSILYRLGGLRFCPEAKDQASLRPEQRELFLQAGCPPPQLRAARASAQVVNGFVVGFTLLDAGYGYTNAPVVQISGGGGSGALGSATVSNGIVTALIVESPGKGYTEIPRVLIGSPNKPPTLRIRTLRVAVDLQVVLGHHYQLHSSADLVNWAPLGPDFVAESETIVREFEPSQAGEYFRLWELP